MPRVLYLLTCAFLAFAAIGTYLAVSGRAMDYTTLVTTCPPVAILPAVHTIEPSSILWADLPGGVPRGAIHR